MSWYVARAGGFLAWALSAFSILWGLLITSRPLGKRISGPRLLDLHRFIGGLSVVFTLVHIVALRLHRFEDLHFGFKELLVPMASDWHPGAVAYGIVAFYLLIAVEITSLVRRRLSPTVWRRVHYSGFIVFLLGSIHALKVGTDVQNPVIWWPSAIISAAVVGLAVTRAMSAAQDSVGRTSDVESELFGSPDSADEPTRTLTIETESVADPLPPWGTPTRTPSPIAEALATTSTSPAVDRAALLERTRRSLEKLDITSYPRAEVPSELLTTRPDAAAESPQAPIADTPLPTRTTDIALRYARLRNPSKPATPATPSFQAVIPADAQRQSNWGQPPAGWGVPTPTPVVDEGEPAEPIVEPVESIVAPTAEPTPPPSPLGLPDPGNRTRYEDQWAVTTTDDTTDEWAPTTSSLDWRVPTRPRQSSSEVSSTAPVADAPVATRSGLPSRTPQRLARSTEPARTPLDWKPQRLQAASMGGAPPPPEPDPETGEVASDQYRAWLREWLAFAESYDG
jgi:DMSO/TMAO reductase YedYZ heme-binding membrane subunit